MNLFESSLGQSDEQDQLGSLSVLIGVTTHAVTLTTISLFTLISTRTELPPKLLNISTPVFQLAAPPPLALRSGSTLKATNRPVPPKTQRFTFLSPQTFTTFDSSMLEPIDDTLLGVPKGFADGVLDGLPLAVYDGVVGGVPSGIPNGIIGGSGINTSDFPNPDTGPKPIRMPKATYTEEALRQNLSGLVKLAVVINEQGKVHVIDIIESVPGLDKIAIDTVETQWLFKPATKNGRPISCISHLIVNFNLNLRQ